MKLKNKRWDFLGLRAAWNDLVQYREWIKIIGKEEKNPKSIYNKYNMGRNSFYNIFVIITLPQEDSVLPFEIQKIRAIESSAPINRYLDETLQFGEYLVPEFNHVYTEEGEPTSSFLFMYSFQFTTISFIWILKRLLGLFIISYVVTKSPWDKIFTWISGLI